MGAERYLQFDVRRPRGGRPLLWPVMVWKVLYPGSRVARVNLFQQAILGLARARCMDGAEMASLLRLDRELVAFIIASQLVPNGWMTGTGAITPRGERALEEAEDASEEMRMGYAYQDALSGEWLPRFTEVLPEIEPSSMDDGGFPVFRRNLDSGREDRPFRLGHGRHGSPNMDALFDALRRYRADHDRARQRDGAQEILTRVPIERPRFAEAHPQPMWLWTWIFRDEAGMQPWLVADPFGLQRAASWLRTPLQELLPRNDAAARYIAKALGERKADEMSAAQWLRSLETQVDLSMLANFGWSGKVPDVQRYLASVLRRQAMLADQERPMPEDLSSLLIETHNLVESVLQWMLAAYPPRIERVPAREKQREWKPGEAEFYLRYFNLACLDDGVIRRLSRQSLDQLRSAARRGASSLKALLFASLLATVDQPAHPLIGLSGSDARLDRILDMADARNKKAGHSGVERIERDEALEYAAFVIEWIQIFKDRY
ncbi:hypothetical protein WQE_04567 [Paraburkholderia hospita]|uniref:Apea-like HEPN domain-containing protein n=1 Tax=Paraburkholderia hospita TaxID=169430 RepID=A0ABN0FU89_9BURK|nr:hypothetical protein [Paraburkholderia hospita]EIN02319.1 hypothetical protein WQE_04567 [Paraburkholderia hospita]OUL86590.1 hypothetical protein CA602_15235 [Paraburkholderia hospita]